MISFSRRALISWALNSIEGLALVGRPTPTRQLHTGQVPTAHRLGDLKMTTSCASLDAGAYDP